MRGYLHAAIFTPETTDLFPLIYSFAVATDSHVP